MSDETILKAAEKRRLTVVRANPAYLVIGTGVVLLAANLFQISLIEYLWPGFVVAPGLMLLWPAYQSTPERLNRLSFLAIPGALLVTIGTLLFAMNLVNYFDAWAYSWTLLPAAVAAGLMYIKRFDSTHPVHENGHAFMRAMFYAFIGLAAFFELVVWANFNPLLPLAIIVFGVYLLRREHRALNAS
jgi:hypothetical protein